MNVVVNIKKHVKTYIDKHGNEIKAPNNFAKAYFQKKAGNNQETEGDKGAKA